LKEEETQFRTFAKVKEYMMVIQKLEDVAVDLLNVGPDDFEKGNVLTIFQQILNAAFLPSSYRCWAPKKDNFVQVLSVEKELSISWGACGIRHVGVAL
jgi:hypothetical protein